MKIIKKLESYEFVFLFFFYKVVDWWLEDMYLTNPLPLPINSNPAFVLPQQDFKDTEGYLKYVIQM